MDTLTPVFVPNRPRSDQQAPPDPQTRRRWERRFEAALDRLRQAGIATIADPQQAANAYVEHRQQWDRYVLGLAHYMAYSYEAVDPAGARPETGAQRPSVHDSPALCALVVCV